MYHLCFFNFRPTELTLKYYTRLIYIYVRQHQLKKRWCEFLLKPEVQQSLLEGTVAFYNGSSRDICFMPLWYSVAFKNQKLDVYAEGVKDKVTACHPNLNPVS